MKYTVLLCYLLTAIAGCSGDPQDTATQPTQETKTQRKYTKKELSAELKAWFHGLSKGPQAGVVSKAAIKVVPNRAWLTQLSLNDKKGVVVNASNESSSFGGGGLNGALHSYVTQAESQANWQSLRIPNGAPVTPGQQVPTGAYAISDVSFGQIYHAVGPRASATTSLTDAQAQVKALYYDMLLKAHNDGMACIVMPAISTAIFAKAGPGFTKEQFITAMYKGMYQGIQQFLGKNPAQQLRIILNYWDPEA